MLSKILSQKDKTVHLKYALDLIILIFFKSLEFYTKEWNSWPFHTLTQWTFSLMITAETEYAFHFKLVNGDFRGWWTEIQLIESVID